MTEKSIGAEERRLQEAARKLVHWRRWGPYVSERQWGTVREDYSAHGEAWDSFPHDHARSRAYRWGEDGKATPDEILMRITVHNRSKDASPTLHLLPSVWFRNTWSWSHVGTRPRLHRVPGPGCATVLVQHETLGERWWHADGNPEVL